jgi:hypothetical protein
MKNLLIEIFCRKLKKLYVAGVFGSKTDFLCSKQLICPETVKK